MLSIARAGKKGFGQLPGGKRPWFRPAPDPARGLRIPPRYRRTLGHLIASGEKDVKEDRILKTRILKSVEYLVRRALLENGAEALNQAARSMKSEMATPWAARRILGGSSLFSSTRDQ